MIKTITVTVWRRPHYFKMLAESLVKNDLTDWKIVVAIDDSDVWLEQKKIIDEILNGDGVERAVWHRNRIQKGVRGNPYFVLGDVFERLNSDINIYLEEDIIISPDVTALANWFAELKSDKEILCTKLINEKCKLTPGHDPKKMYLCQDQFSALGMIIKKDMWFKYFKPNWFKDFPEITGGVGWDWSIHKGVLEQNPDLYTIMPEFSRSNHTGREGGVHCTTVGHDLTFGDIDVYDGKKQKYHLTSYV